MAKQYTTQENEPLMANEDAVAYPQGVTIPITLPTTGDYSVEFLKKELTDFAMRLLHRAKPAESIRTEEHTAPAVKKHSAWVQSMAKFRHLDPMDSKEALIGSLDERFG